jgi:hypothetical protein
MLYFTVYNKSDTFGIIWLMIPEKATHFGICVYETITVSNMEYLPIIFTQQ